MNKRKDPYDYGSRLRQEPTDRVHELERELVEEKKNRPVLAALLMMLLVFVLLVLGIIVYSIVGGGEPPAAGSVRSSAEMMAETGNSSRWDCI